MKTAIITLTILVAFATPGLATDSLHLLATVAAQKTDEAGEVLQNTQKVKNAKKEAQLNSKSVNPIVMSRDKALNY